MRSHLLLVLPALLISLFLTGCEDHTVPSSDQTQATQQEAILQEGTAQTGMPAIKNFRERKMLKDILELRDQNGITTYTYLANEIPHEVHGHTCLGGKLTFLGESIGYGIPYATEYTNPQKVLEYGGGTSNYGNVVIAQADPNGLFAPAAAEGTWIMMLDPKKKKALPQYIEPRIAVFSYRLPPD